MLIDRVSKLQSELALSEKRFEKMLKESEDKYKESQKNMKYPKNI